MNLDQRSQSRRSVELAAAALAASRAADALAHAQAALAIDPGAVDARMIEAEANLLLNEPAKALRCLDTISYYAPASHQRPDFALLRARTLIAAGKDVAAHAQLCELVREYPHDARPRRLLAGVCLKLEDNASAIGELRQVLKLEPNDQATRRLLADLIGEENPDEALKLLEPALRIDADLVSRWRKMRWLAQAGRLADAEETCRDLIGEAARKPRDAASGEPRPTETTDDALVLLEAGRLAERQGAVDAAQRRLTRALAGDAGKAVRLAAALSLAVTLLRAGRWSPAAWWAWKVVRLDAADVDAWAVLAIAALQLQRTRLIDRAKDQLSRWTATEQRRALSRAWLNASAGVVIDEFREDGDAGIAGMAPSRGHAEGDAHSHSSLESAAHINSPLKHLLRQAAATFEHHAATRHHWADTHYHLAVCSGALGDFSAARQAVQAALDINPHYRAATQLAARLPKAA